MNVAAGERVSLVTGGTDGIGRAVALRLARGGDRVLFVGRSANRGAEVLAALREAHPEAQHAFLPADLSLLSETARVAEEVTRHTTRLDAVVSCAGILSTVPDWTDEGLERSFVLNYLSRYLLARRLIPILKGAPSGRLVFVANAGVYGDGLDLDDLQYRRGRPGLRVAGRTQYANDLLTVELAERLRGTRVEVTCVFPGVTGTSFLGNARGLPVIARALAPVVRLISQPPEAAALTPTFLAQDARAADTGGRFFGPNLKERPVPSRSSRPEPRGGLWAASEDLVRPYLPVAGSAGAPETTSPPDARLGAPRRRPSREVDGQTPKTMEGEAMSKAGDVYENPITGERAVVRVGTEESGGELLVVDLYVSPAGRVAAEHVHPILNEWFTVIRGRIGFRLDGQQSVAEIDKRLHVRPGTAHDWWNAGEEEAHVVVEVSPAARFEEAISTIFGLARDGKTNSKGMPNPLQLALLAREFEDVLYFTKPPRAVQKVLFAALAPVARLLGYRGSHPEYGPSGFIEVEPWPGHARSQTPATH